MRVAVSQIDITLGDLDGNCHKILANMQRARDEGVALVVFPECALSGYLFSSPGDARRAAIGRNDQRLTSIACLADTLGLFVVVGFIEVEGEQLFNTAAFFGRDGFSQFYRKTHLPHIGVDRFATPGDSGFIVHATALGRIGICICYDQSFPESARILALRGAQLIVLITNWAENARDVCNILTNARALENRVFYLAANRVGVESGMRFIGKSKIIDCFGKTLVEGSEGQEDFIQSTLDLTLADQKRVVVVPGEYEVDRINDRRPETYGALTEPARR